ncbi:hypothetical protein [Nannocystis pusilla]|uniref:hypothetical protein n=1 Tax=Nannocystis pusilla TaxID=889268 RepID=UPI003DA2101C
MARNLDHADASGAAWVGSTHRRTVTSQRSSGTKAAISRSRSTISLTATDCTRPADSPRATFFHSSGDAW